MSLLLPFSLEKLKRGNYVFALSIPAFAAKIADSLQESRKRPDCLHVENHVEACQLDFLMIYADHPTNPRFV
jgi:hypothetical protein